MGRAEGQRQHVPEPVQVVGIEITADQSRTDVAGRVINDGFQLIDTILVVDAGVEIHIPDAQVAPGGSHGWREVGGVSQLARDFLGHTRFPLCVPDFLEQVSASRNRGAFRIALRTLTGSVSFAMFSETTESVRSSTTWAGLGKYVWKTQRILLKEAL